MAEIGGVPESAPAIARADALSSRFRWQSLLEAAALLLLLAFLGPWIDPGDPGYLGVSPHPFWIVVILVAVRYGFAETLAASALAAFLFCGYLLATPRATFEYSTLRLLLVFREPLLFLVVGGVISEFSESRAKRALALRHQLARKQGEIERAEDRNRALTESLRRLENRIAGQFTSIVDLFTSHAETRRMPVEEIRRHLLRTLARFLQVESASWYDVAPGGLVRSIAGPEAPARIEADLCVQEARRANRVFHLAQFDRGEVQDRARELSVFAGPVRGASGEVFGVVGVERLPFTEYNPYTMKLFATILDWWGAAIAERRDIDALREKSLFNEELGIYNHAYFLRRFAEEFRRSRTFSLPLALAILRIERYAEVGVAQRPGLRRMIGGIVSDAVTDLDMVSCGAREECVIVTFPLTMAVDAAAKMKRIAAGIAAFDFHPYRDPEAALAIRWAVAEYAIGMEKAEELFRAVTARLDDPVAAVTPPVSPAESAPVVKKPRKGRRKPRPAD